MSKNIGYLIGYFFGWVLIYGLYAFAVIAITIDLINHTMPVLPVMMLLTIYMFRKVLQASYILNEFNALTQTMDMNRHSTNKTNADLDKMMNRMNQFGGKN